MGGYGTIIVDLIAATSAATGICGLAAASSLRAMKEGEPEEEPERNPGPSPPTCWSHCYTELVENKSDTPHSRLPKVSVLILLSIHTSVHKSFEESQKPLESNCHVGVTKTSQC